MEEEDSSLELDLLSSLLLSSLELDLLSSLVFSSLSLPSEVVMEIGKEELSSSLEEEEEEREELLEVGVLAPQLANNIVRENNENPCKNRLFSIELDSLMVIPHLILSPLGIEGKGEEDKGIFFLFFLEGRKEGIWIYDIGKNVLLECPFY